MITPSRIFLILLVFAVVIQLGCKKDTALVQEDVFVQHTEDFSALNIEVSGAGYQFIELQWKPVKNSYYKPVSYAIYVDDKKVMEGISTTKYSAINLLSGQKYTLKVVASTADGQEVSQVITTSTLSRSTDQLSTYREYNLHSFSSIGGATAVQRFSDGGHLLVKNLSHDTYFDDESNKILIFRTDAQGNMLWYKLLSPKNYNTPSIYAAWQLILHHEEQEAILALGDFLIKFSTTNGEIIERKSYGTTLNKLIFQCIYYNSSQELLIGTQQGTLLCINPNTLALSWIRENTDKIGSIIDIKVDSKKNIYYIFVDRSDRYPNIRIHKCDLQGLFVKSFLFDGTLPGESNWGFNMTSLAIDKEDNLYLVGHNNDYAFLRFFKFDSEGNVIKKNQTSDGLLAKKVFLNASGEVVILGQRTGSGFVSYSAIYILDSSMNIKSKVNYTDLPYHAVSGITDNSDGTYNIFLNYFTTYTYTNKNFIFIKTGLNGKI
ncbi:hypothetical protein SAMN05421827_101514 [Pedobacter terrae]|uniref:Fibronectin type-III domain-containing protein n=1 Tax=Pedobacter terrae TaxID=405671 RepID=A0A1G7NUX9_9SPHI|nr:hypothetical protein [Pedobacter terrae]SDF77846.1 hypothetical protein SAMN05421827_101514 [Pedobacter terrae]